jgi:peptidoglycan/xylan/chitin deacetylase (PgdA/CDA1 family)
MYLVKSPLLLKWYYPSLTWNKTRNEKVIYLTFDDGPIPDVTTFVLKTLKDFNAKATFFCIGDNIMKHPEVFAEIKKTVIRLEITPSTTLKAGKRQIQFIWRTLKSASK